MPKAISEGAKAATIMGKAPEMPKAFVSFDKKNKIKAKRNASVVLYKAPPCRWLMDRPQMAAIKTMAIKYTAAAYNE